MNNELIVTLPVLVGLIMGIVQVIKGFIPERFVPLSALCIGVALSTLWTGFDSASIFTGLFAGLSSMGLFSGSKASLGE